MDILDFLTDSKLFAVLDLTSGYRQIEIECENIQKTAFSATKGHFKFNIMSFQHLMECFSADLSGAHCLVYLDNINLFSKIIEDNLQ